MIRYLQLPFHFDSALLQQDVMNITTAWKAHFNQRDYEGNWSGLSLRAPGGSMDNIFAENLSDKAPFEDTPLLKQCAYIQHLLSSITCTQTSVRLLKLESDAIVHEHTDAGLLFEQGEARLHIPVYTHPQVEFYLDGDRLNMEAGTCWYINASLPHRLANPSPVSRIHLVVDCLVNDWLKNWFEKPDLPVKSIKDTTEADHQRQRAIIEALRQSNDPHRILLAEQMEQEDQRTAF